MAVKRRALLFGWPAAVLAVVWIGGAVTGTVAIAAVVLLELGVALGEGTHPPPTRARGELVDLTGRHPK